MIRVVESAVYVTYFDEVKYEPGAQPFYWLCGFGLSMSDVPALEESVNKLADECFGFRTLVAKTEFHAKDILHGKANFKGWPWERRVEVLKKLVLLLHDPERITKFYVRIIPENIKFSSTPPHEIAYMYFLEMVDQFLTSKNSHGMLFADRDDEQVGKAVESLSRYREKGTTWAMGRKLVKIVDTVHFARSHHSRLVQLSDIFVYAAQFLYAAHFDKPPKQYYRQVFGEFLKKESNLLENCRFKAWPQEPIWYRS